MTDDKTPTLGEVADRAFEAVRNAQWLKGGNAVPARDAWESAAEAVRAEVLRRLIANAGVPLKCEARDIEFIHKQEPSMWPVRTLLAGLDATRALVAALTERAERAEAELSLLRREFCQAEDDVHAHVAQRRAAEAERDGLRAQVEAVREAEERLGQELTLTAAQRRGDNRCEHCGSKYHHTPQHEPAVQAFLSAVARSREALASPPSPSEPQTGKEPTDLRAAWEILERDVSADLSTYKPAIENAAVRRFLDGPWTSPTVAAAAEAMKLSLKGG